MLLTHPYIYIRHIGNESFEKRKTIMHVAGENGIQKKSDERNDNNNYNRRNSISMLGNVPNATTTQSKASKEHAT